MSGLTIQSSQNPQEGWSWIPDEVEDPIVHGVFSKLTHDVLADVISLVCKQWKGWADKAPVWTARHLSQLNVRILSRQAIEEELKRALPPAMFVQLSFDKIPHTIDFRMALIKASRFYAGIQAAGTAVEGAEGLFIVPRPEGLTLRMLHTAYPTRFEYIWEWILEKLGDKKSEGGQFMITSNILEKTRKKTVDEQQTLSQKAGGDLPEVLNAVFYALMVEKFTENLGSYTRSGLNPFDTEHPFSRGQCTYVIRPLNDDPWTYTRCLERMNWPLAVGGFFPAGLYVYDYPHCVSGDDAGGCILRKF